MADIEADPLASDFPDVATDAEAEIISFPGSDRGAERRPANPVKVRDAIGEVLREERSDQERTLADVAEDAAVSLQYLSEIERGRKEVSSDLLESVCYALELEVADVLERAAQHIRIRSVQAQASAANRFGARSNRSQTFMLAA